MGVCLHKTEVNECCHYTAGSPNNNFQLQRKNWELIICELIKNVCMIIRVATAEWRAEEVEGGQSVLKRANWQ